MINVVDMIVATPTDADDNIFERCQDFMIPLE
jgi:hypothetical protein